MPKKETTIKKQAETKAVDEAMIKEVLARVAEIGVRKAAAEAGIAWQTVSKWKKDAEKELTTPEDIKTAVEELADIMNPPVEEKIATAVEEKAKPAVEEKPIKEVKPAPAAVEEKKNEKAEKIDLIIESTMGGQISADEIINRVKEKRSDAAKIYVKPEENKAYFTYGDSVGAIELW